MPPWRFLPLQSFNRSSRVSSPKLSPLRIDPPPGRTTRSPICSRRKSSTGRVSATSMYLEPTTTTSVEERTTFSVKTLRANIAPSLPKSTANPRIARCPSGPSFTNTFSNLRPPRLPKPRPSPPPKLPQKSSSGPSTQAASPRPRTRSRPRFSTARASTLSKEANRSPKRAIYVARPRSTTWARLVRTLNYSPLLRKRPLEPSPLPRTLRIVKTSTTPTSPLRATRSISLRPSLRHSRVLDSEAEAATLLLP